MPKRRKQSVAMKRKKMKLRRSRETTPERNKRLESARIRNSISRVLETQSQRMQRLEASRKYMRRRRECSRPRHGINRASRTISKRNEHLDFGLYHEAGNFTFFEKMGTNFQASISGKNEASICSVFREGAIQQLQQITRKLIQNNVLSSEAGSTSLPASCHEKEIEVSYVSPSLADDPLAIQGTEAVSLTNVNVLNLEEHSSNNIAINDVIKKLMDVGEVDITSNLIKKEMYVEHSKFIPLSSAELVPIIENNSFIKCDSAFEYQEESVVKNSVSELVKGEPLNIKTEVGF